MVTTREMLETVKEDHGAPGAPVKVGIDVYKAYEDLRNATPEELLAAVEWFYRQSSLPPEDVKVAVSFMRSGFQLAQTGGWERVAPKWLRESRRLAALDQ